MVGIDIDEAKYRLHWCKGDYYSMSGNHPRLCKSTHRRSRTHSGSIHTVPDLTGRPSSGPNAYYVDNLDYRVESPVEPFWSDIVTYLPSVRKRISPRYGGDTCKARDPAKARDFIMNTRRNGAADSSTSGIEVT
jgi:L-2-hydroxyglutarate oxidase LhgO